MATSGVSRVVTSKPSSLTGELVTCFPAVDPRVSPVEESGSDSLTRRVEQWAIRVGLRALLGLYAGAVAIARGVRRPPRPRGASGLDILLTGTFHSDNWVRSHLMPLAASSHCARVRVVSIVPIPDMPKVEPVYPPAWLVRAIGSVPARLVVFVSTAVRTRPDVVGGFHLLFNGLLTALVAPLAGAKSLYFCVGGPAEMLGGGVTSENRLFGRLTRPEKAIERRLLAAVGTFDLVITMGRQAIAFFRDRGVDTRFHVVSGGIDSHRFAPTGVPPAYDLILVARLAPIKQIDVFLHAVACVRRVRPDVTAVILGDGPLMEPLEQLACQLGLQSHVTFAGRQADVDAWLKRSRLFVLTSQSEGLALSMMEAMVCGLPAIVPDVGDLGELVEDGVNGYLVSTPTPEAFAARILDLLADRSRLERFSAAARLAALRYDVSATTRIWDELLTRDLGRRSRPGD